MRTTRDGVNSNSTCSLLVDAVASTAPATKIQMFPSTAHSAGGRATAIISHAVALERRVAPIAV